MKSIDIEYAKSVLHYNPDTGIFTWIASPATRVKIGDIAGSLTTNGYMVISLKRISFKAHRIAWVMHYGVQPKELDHINTIKSDNRIANLRECTVSQNQSNKPARKKNTSGRKGVCWNKATSKWQASISKDGKDIYIGRFANIEDAAAAYAKAAKIHHGEFARIN